MSDPSGLATRAWLGRLDAERSCRYYVAASKRYRRRYHITALTILIASALAGMLAWVALQTGSPVAQWVGSGFSFVAGVAAGVLLRFNDARTLAKAESASDYFAMMGRDWAHVWLNRADPNDHTNIRVLEERMWAAPDVGITIDDELNDRCQTEAEQVVLGEYKLYAAQSA